MIHQSVWYSRVQYEKRKPIEFVTEVHILNVSEVIHCRIVLYNNIPKRKRLRTAPGPSESARLRLSLFQANKL